MSYYKHAQYSYSYSSGAPCSSFGLYDLLGNVSEVVIVNGEYKIVGCNRDKGLGYKNAQKPPAFIYEYIILNGNIPRDRISPINSTFNRRNKIPSQVKNTNWKSCYFH